MRTVRKIAGIAIAMAAIALLGATPASNYAMSFTDLVNNQAAGGYTWKGSAPATSNKLVSWSDFQTYVNTQACSVSNANQIMTWNDVLSCASTHIVSQQSKAVTGNYHTIYYNARYLSNTQSWLCGSPQGSDGYTGTPITLPAGTVAPTSSSTQLSLALSSITWPGTSSSLTISLYNPSGGFVTSWTVNAPSASSPTYTYSAAGAPAGTWQWQITQTGGSDGACDPTNGSSGGNAQVTWSGTAYFYQ